MKRSRIIGIVAVLALVAAACSGGDDDAPSSTAAARPRATGTGGSLGLRGEHRCRPGVGREGPRPRGAVG